MFDLITTDFKCLHGDNFLDLFTEFSGLHTGSQTPHRLPDSTPAAGPHSSEVRFDIILFSPNDPKL